jgi:hypothetical protein
MTAPRACMWVCRWSARVAACVRVRKAGAKGTDSGRARSRAGRGSAGAVPALAGPSCCEGEARRERSGGVLDWLAGRRADARARGRLCCCCCLPVGDLRRCMVSDAFPRPIAAAREPRGGRPPPSRPSRLAPPPPPQRKKSPSAWSSFSTSSFQLSLPNRTLSMSSLHPLRAKYGDSLPTLSAIFPDWAEDDLLLVLDESKGALDVAVNSITDGPSPLSASLPSPPIGRPPCSRSSLALATRAASRDPLPLDCPSRAIEAQLDACEGKGHLDGACRSSSSSPSHLCAGACQRSAVHLPPSDAFLGLHRSSSSLRLVVPKLVA